VVAFLVAGGVAFLVAFVVLGVVVFLVAGGVVGGVVGGVAGGVAGVVAGVVAGGVAFVVAGVVAGVVGAISTISLPIFIFLCWLVGASLLPNRQKWLGLIAAGAIFTLRIEHQAWEAVLSIAITLIGYYRLFPYFGIFTIFIQSTTSIFHRIKTNPFQLLSLLPPFTSELLWLPLPNHDRLLIAAFRQNPLEAIPIFQSIQKQPLYGFQQTIKTALPQLVADQLIAVQTILELITTATPNHAILPLLVPSLYQSELVDTQSLNVELLPTFQKYAQNIDAALQAGSIALRERGLERILDQLSTLNSQLSGLVKSKSIPRWQAVIKQWQNIIQQELEQLQRQSQGEILNPFQYGNPLTRDRAQLFKGRSAFADQIVRQILDRNRPTIILHGPRRCGKSSFLLNLPRLLTSDVLPVYIDLQSQSASQSEADFCFTIVRAIHRDARSQQVLLPTPPKREEFRLSPYTQLEDWLDTALAQLGDRRILLNIDEFEAIGTAMEQGRISTNLFDELRSLIQHWDRLSFLFSGVQTLDELGTNWSSYFISAMPIEMTYLNPNEARELLLNPDPEFTLEYDTGIVDQILTLTRCHPYLLQLLGWVLVQLANTTHTQLVTPTLLQSAIPEAYINGIGYFTNVWEQFTGTTPTEITAGQQQLLALAQGQQPHPTNESDQKSLQRMLRYHIIEKIDNQYKFEVPLIERWVKEKTI
jgi:AAA+ ATPase superfamily predicted ATPase